jgi:hypothetical protein
MVCIIGGETYFGKIEEEWSFSKKLSYVISSINSKISCFSMSIKNNKYKILALLLVNCLPLAQAAKAAKGGTDNNGAFPEGSGFIATLCCCCCCLV